MRVKPSTAKPFLSAVTSSTRPFHRDVNIHLSTLALQFSLIQPQRTPSSPSNFASRRNFSNSSPAFRSPSGRNQINTSLRRPSDFHDLLQLSSASDTLLLALFTTSTCNSCSTIIPLLESIVQNRASPSPGDGFTGGLTFTEIELDSPDRDDDGGSGGRGWTSMYDVGMEYGVRSVPTLIGFGGVRSQRVTDRIADEKRLKDRQWLEQWIDEVMRKGDPGASAGGGGQSFLGKLFGGGG